MKIVLGYHASQENVEQIRRLLTIRIDGSASSSPSYELVNCSEQEVAFHLLDADIFCGHVKTKVDWEKVVSNKRLRWIQSSAAGMDHCLVPELLNSDICVSSASGLFSQQVSETTLALLFGLIRRLDLFSNAKVKREYVRRPTGTLSGKNVGIIGFGGNGQMIATHLSAFQDVQVWASDFFVDHGIQPGYGAFRQVNQIVRHDKYEIFLHETDVLIVTVGLTELTRNQINADILQKMKPGSYLINVGRGEVVQTEALVDALQSGHLAGAAIDVVDPEPLPPQHPLWDFENVLITPHIGAQSPTRFDDVTTFFCENLDRWFEDSELLNRVEFDLGFPLPENRFNPRTDSLHFGYRRYGYDRKAWASRSQHFRKG